MDVCIAEPQETAIYVEDWMVPPGVVEQETLNVISPLYIFPLKTCVTPGPWIVGISPQSLLLLCNMPTMLSVDFVFLYPASHFMDQYCSFWSWTHEKFSMHHHLLKDRRCYFFFVIWAFFCDFWAFYNFDLNLHSGMSLGGALLFYLKFNTCSLWHKLISLLEKVQWVIVLGFRFILLTVVPQLAKKIREKFNRYLDVVNRNKQVVEASYTAHLTSPLTAIQDCCTIPPSMME